MGAHESVLPCARATSGVEKVLPFALRLVEFWVVAFCRMFSVFWLAALGLPQTHTRHLYFKPEGRSISVNSISVNSISVNYTVVVAVQARPQPR